MSGTNLEVRELSYSFPFKNSAREIFYNVVKSLKINLSGAHFSFNFLFVISSFADFNWLFEEIVLDSWSSFPKMTFGGY